MVLKMFTAKSLTIALDIFCDPTLTEPIAMDLKSQIAGYIKDKYEAEVADDESLFERGYLDSMALLELMSFIEESTGVKVPASEVLPENFETLSNIQALVRRLQS